MTASLRSSTILLASHGMMTTTLPSQTTARILVVDDHELVRVGMAQLVRRQPNWEVVGEADHAATAMQLARETRPNVALVDLRLASGDGLELIKQFKAAFPEIRSLVSSMQEERLYAERALRAGALGYISKQEPVQQLIVAIRRVLEGKVYLSPAMTEVMLSRAAAGVNVEQPSIELLSDREIEVFELLGRGKSVKDIALQLHLSPKTIEYHRQRIKEKLRITSSNTLLRHATMHVLNQA
jgi:DNA-binding NarL/FixJ family response regulator